MLVTFRSPVAADVIMFGDAAKMLLEILGKDPEQKTGIILAENLPTAISRLQNAMSHVNTNVNGDVGAGEPKDEEPQGLDAPVNLAQRAYPLLEMMERALKAKEPVTWGE